jgi:1-acyl-sn-glycerol-3-phosphate acyltransferase
MLRVYWRLAAIVLHVLLGLAITYLVFPCVGRPRRRRIIRSWSRWLLRWCGMALDPRGAGATAAPGVGLMWVANHVSWLDVFLLHAISPGMFIAKSEIRSWPLLGALTAGAGTIFIERGSRHAVHHVNTLIGQALDAGETVVVFAEGTTSDGTQLLPFHANLFATPVQRGTPVQPVGLRYLEHGVLSTAPAFTQGRTLMDCLLSILRSRALRAEVHLLDPIDPAVQEPARAARHAVARQAQDAIAACLALDVADRAPEKPHAPAGARR